MHGAINEEESERGLVGEPRSPGCGCLNQADNQAWQQKGLQKKMKLSGIGGRLLKLRPLSAPYLHSSQVIKALLHFNWKGIFKKRKKKKNKASIWGSKKVSLRIYNNNPKSSVGWRGLRNWYGIGQWWPSGTQKRQ